MKIKFVLTYWLPVCIWLLVIFSFSANPAIPTSQIHWQDFIVKKAAHVIEYAILSTLIFRALYNSGVSKKASVYVSFILCVVYALTDEFHQSFTPGREPRLRDVGFDTIGAGLAQYLIWIYLPKAPKKLKTLATKLELV
jgi:hypothetical protein